MAKEDDVLNKCGHRNSERIEAFEALKKLPSAVCPACLFERIKELETECCEETDRATKFYERIKELEAALRKYSDHLDSCYKNLRIGDCNCGFEQVLKSGK